MARDVPYPSDYRHLKTGISCRERGCDTLDIGSISTQATPIVRWTTMSPILWYIEEQLLLASLSLRMERKGTGWLPEPGYYA